MHPSSPALEPKREKTSTVTVLLLGAMLDSEEGDPDTVEHRHAECQEPGFIESVREVPGQQSHLETLY